VSSYEQFEPELVPLNAVRIDGGTLQRRDPGHHPHRQPARRGAVRSAPTPLTACAASTKHAQGFPSAVAKVPGAPCSATPAEIVWIR
jgi:hypothetical protein